MTPRLNSTWSTHWFHVNSTKSVYIYVNNILITWHIHFQGSMIQKDNVNENKHLIEINNNYY